LNIAIYKKNRASGGFNDLFAFARSYINVGRSVVTRMPQNKTITVTKILVFDFKLFIGG
jgi:hypothetical protein